MFERASRRAKIFVVLALPAIAFGLFLLVVSGRMAWNAWDHVARWPRANAVLVSKDISSALMIRGER